MKRMKLKVQPITGKWIHPADGDDYPNKLTMRVKETRMPGSTSWEVITAGHQAPFGPSEHQYVHLEGGRRLFMASRRPDGTFTELTTMAEEKWGVSDGTAAEARKVLGRFFAELGYARVEA